MSQDQFALVMSVVGHEIRMTKIPNFAPPPGTVLGWEVGDMQATASLARESRREPGKVFFRRTVKAKFGRLRSGDQVARLKDPDANIVSGGPSLRTGVVW